MRKRATLVLLALVLWVGVGLCEKGRLAGWIVKVEGVVTVKRAGEFKGKRVTENGTELFVGDVIRTKRGSRAFIKFVDGTKVVLEERSVLVVEDLKQVSSDRGRIYFRIRKGVKGRKARISNILIGVKGTEFAVDVREKGTSVFVNEGVVEVENLEGEFKRYMKRHEEEFERFRKEREEEFERYRRELEKEFYAFVKSFELYAGKAVSIVGNEVRDIEIPKEVLEGFKLLDF